MFGAFRHLSVVFFKHGFSYDHIFCFGSSVVGILLWGSGVKMGRLDTTASIAHVQNMLVFGYRSPGDLIDSPVCQHLASVLPNQSIAFGIESASPD